MASSPVASPSAETFFPHDAAVRRVHREGVLLLGGGRALLMQIAHPDIARGVAEHSSYSSRKIDRLLRTLRATLAMAYGTREQAMQAAAGVNRLHQRVQGESYSAMDTPLQVWVLATLIDTAVEMHTRFLGPMDPELAGEYYADMSRLGGLMGVPVGAMPGSMAEMRDYVVTMCESLSVSDTARHIAADLFRAPLVAAPAMWSIQQLTAGLLHPALREGFGLTWGRGRDLSLRKMESASRLLLPRMPLPLRRTPAFLLPAGTRL